MKPYEKLASYCDEHGHQLGIFRVGLRFELRVTRAISGSAVSARFNVIDRDEAAIELLSKLALKA